MITCKNEMFIYEVESKRKDQEIVYWWTFFLIGQNSLNTIQKAVYQPIKIRVQATVESHVRRGWYIVQKPAISSNLRPLALSQHGV